MARSAEVPARTKEAPQTRTACSGNGPPEEALAARERYYRSLLNGMHEDIVVVDPEYRITDVNNSFVRTIGRPREEVLGALYYETWQGYDAPCDEHGEVLDVLESGQARRCVHQHVRADGSTAYVDILLSPVRDAQGCVTHVVGAMRDITTMMRAQTTLRESEERYRTMFESASQGILIADVETKTFRYANPAVSRMLGYSIEELMRMSVHDIHPPESIEHVIAEFEVQARGDKTLSERTPCTRKDGTTIFADISTAPMLIDGRACNVGFYTNVTDRVQLEDQFRQSQKMEAIGRLAGGVAHDFNNLLTGIYGYMHFALESSEPGSEVHQNLTEALSLADRTADLTRQLLAFSRRQTLQPEVVDLNALIGDQIKMLARIIGEDLEPTFFPAEDLGSVRVDRGQMELTVLNLAVNARDAMPQGGRLTIETSNVTLSRDDAATHVHVKPGDFVLLAVTDTGCGMDEETRKHIFEPFFTTKEQGKGTGLGLATVYGIVKQHSGNIWVYSEPGKGTTFKIYLPRVRQKAGPPPAAARETPDAQGTETILLVEDDRAVREVARWALNARGFHVFPAASALEARHAFAASRGRIDLLLTDVVMPGAGGRELYEELIQRCPNLKVLYMSGYANNAIVHHGIVDDGPPFLQKPFDGRTLARKVRAVLDM